MTHKFYVIMKGNLIYWSHKWQTRQGEMLLSRKRYILQKRSHFYCWFQIKVITGDLDHFLGKSYFTSEKLILIRQKAAIHHGVNSTEWMLSTWVKWPSFFSGSYMENKSWNLNIIWNGKQKAGCSGSRRQTPFSTGLLSGFNKRPLIRRDAASWEGLRQ